MCMVSAANKAVDFGSVKSVQWSDGVENGASIEAIYGNGELCNNGIPRKTIVEYVCDLNKKSNSQAIVSVAMIDECTAKMIVESAYACPVKVYCASIASSDSCSNQDKLCRWSSGKCEAATGCAGWRQLTEGESGGLVLIILVTLIGAAVACTCGLCVCCCVRKRRARKGKKCMMMRRCSKRNGKTPSKKRSAKKQEQQEVEYAPFQMPLQLIPGGFAPINPYSNIQGYPMVTLVAPGGEDEQV